MKNSRFHVLLLLLVTLIGQGYSQTNQRKPQPGTTDALRSKQAASRTTRQRLVSLMSTLSLQVDDAAPLTTPTHLAIRISWITPPATGMRMEEILQRSPTVKSSSIQRLAGGVPVRRSMELASDHLLVLSVAGTHVRWWSLVPDPRVLRSEGPDANNRLSGDVIQLNDVDFLLDIPDDDSATELRLYHPHWTGEEFALVLIGSLALKN